jgi:hypothetical protein
VSNASSDGPSGDLPAPPLAPPVWALDCSDRFIVLGCSNGRIEVWELEAGAFQVCSKRLQFERLF